MNDIEMAVSHVTQAVNLLRRERTTEAERLISELQPLAGKIEKLDVPVPFSPSIEVLGNLTVGYILRCHKAPHSFVDVNFESAAKLKDALNEALGRSMDL